MSLYLSPVLLKHHGSACVFEQSSFESLPLPSSSVSLSTSATDHSYILFDQVIPCLLALAPFAQPSRKSGFADDTVPREADRESADRGL